MRFHVPPHRRLPVVIVLALVVALAATAVPAKTFDATDIAKLRSVGAAAISPDGKHVAYLLAVPRAPYAEDSGKAWRELHVTGRDAPARAFVTGKVRIESVSWSADGGTLHFLAKRGDDEHVGLYRIAVAGGEAVRLVGHKSDIKSFSFSPDGKRVAFLAKDADSAKTKKLKEKGFDAEIYEEDWRPVAVWIADINGEDPSPRRLDLPGSASLLHWSPAGDRLALALAPTSLIDDEYMARKVHVVDANNGQVLAKIDNPGKLDRIRFSPDGKRLAFISGQDPNDPAEGRLMVAPAAGGALTDVVPGYMGHVRSFAWKDANTLLYIGDEGVWTTLASVRADGSARKTLIPTGGTILGGIDLDAAGKTAVFLGEAPQHPNEVYTWREGQTAAVRLTDSNPWLKEMQMAPQEVVRFKARDGLEIEGLLVRPLDEKQGKRYPLVMIVHGGPESHHRNGWQTTYSRPAQLMAAEGFAVFFTNYRASTGRGVEFSKLDHGDFAGREYDDLVDAVDHLISTGLVDKDRVGITGGSYGGYATAWASTYYSDRFAAGVMFVGISNLLSKVGTSDIPNELYQVHMRVHPWDDWQLFLERSPIYHVQKARTPLLIIHGKDDPRVFPGQSMELYRYLKTLGQVPVRLVFYPGEGHGNQKSAARLDYTLRLMRWMKFYLQGEGKEKGEAMPPYELDYPFEVKVEEEEEG